MDLEEAWVVALAPVQDSLDGLSAAALALVLGPRQPGIAGDTFGSRTSKRSRDLHHLRHNRKGR
jgi:hypothetical protein